MKAVLVIDMPKDCWDCHLVDEWGNCNAIKMTSERYGVSVKQYDKERASWCPLRPLPKKMNETEYMQKVNSDGDWYEQVVGWNNCIDEITGETE